MPADGERAVDARADQLGRHVANEGTVEGLHRDRRIWKTSNSWPEMYNRCTYEMPLVILYLVQIRDCTHMYKV